MLRRPAAAGPGTGPPGRSEDRAVVAGRSDLAAAQRPQLSLRLELPLELPALPIDPEWKDQPRLWGHPLHPMCSYLASFPAALAHAFIGR